MNSIPQGKCGYKVPARRGKRGRSLRNCCEHYHHRRSGAFDFRQKSVEQTGSGLNRQWTDLLLWLGMREPESQEHPAVRQGIVDDQRF
jgi:hypothetical protein